MYYDMTNREIRMAIMYASDLRKKLGMDDIVGTPAKKIIETINAKTDKNIDVLFEDFTKENTFDFLTNDEKKLINGILYYRGLNNYTMVINSAKPETRQKFTIAHEIGHIFLGHLGKQHKVAFRLDFDRSNCLTEQEANAFAAELLMPSEQVPAMIKQYTPAAIAKLLGVSEQALRYKMKTLGL